MPSLETSHRLLRTVSVPPQCRHGGNSLRDRRPVTPAGDPSSLTCLSHCLFWIARPGFEMESPAQGLVQQSDGCFDPLGIHGIRDPGKCFVSPRTHESGNARPEGDLRTELIAYRIDRIRCRIMIGNLA